MATDQRPAVDLQAIAGVERLIHEPGRLLVLACLAKDPEERPASADHLAEALVSIAGSSPWTAEAAREWWDRHQPREAPATK